MGSSPLRFSDILPARVCDNPEAVAVVFGDLRWTYAELSRRVDACASAMLASDVVHGDRIATLSTPRPDSLVVYLASIKIGAMWIGLNPVQQVDEYLYLLSDAGPKLLFALDRFRHRDNRPIIEALQRRAASLQQVVVFGSAPEGTLTYTQFLGLGEAISPDQLVRRAASVLPDDAAILVYTSGSTGKPKGAMLTQRNVAFAGALYASRWLHQPLRAICNLPISHIAYSTETVAFVLTAAGTLVFQETFEAEAFLEVIARERITWVLVLPTMMHRIFKLPEWQHAETSSLRVLVFGGAAMSPDMIEQLARLCPNVFTLWGLTESTAAVTFTEAGDSLDVLATSIGKAAPGCEVGVMKDGVLVVTGEIGEIVIRGDCVFAGYLGTPGASAAGIDAEGWLHSGDLGRCDADGRFYIVGRIKDMFKSGGYNVYPREVEATIEGHPMAALCAVVPVPDPIYQEVGIAFIVPARDRQVSPQEIEDHCRARLGNYKIPKRFIVLDDLPMLSIGKIDKVALRSIARELTAKSPPSS